MIGQTISHYKILEKIGAGGMGVVYKAEDTNLKRIVALKFLPPELTRDQDAKKRFLHEARAASALDHPNICAIHEIDETDDGQMFMAMGYYQGQTLKDIISPVGARGAVPSDQSGSPLPIYDALDIAIQIAEGLNKAHQKGIVHRDIKSANIIITEEGVIKILDFGLAKLKGATKLTKEGTTLGTVSYMSPEQTSGDKVDHRSDIWSLGVILYEMLTGRLPFKGEYEQAIMYAIMNEEPEPVTGLRSGIPLELELIINKLLSKNASQRYQSLNELIIDINKIQINLSSNETHSVGKKRPGTAPKKSAAAVIGIIIVVIAGYFIMIKNSIPTEPEPKKTLSKPAMARTAWKNSIAVLPFSDLSPKKDQEYFCDGMTEQIITNLAQIPGLKVIARTSVMLYKNTVKDIRKISQELGVKYVMEGSVRKTDKKLRVTAQLIDADNGFHIWAKDYDQPLEDTFEIQDRVSQALAIALETTVSSPSGQSRSLTQHLTRPNLTSKPLFSSRYPKNIEAYEWHLKARYQLDNIYLKTHDEKDFQEALTMAKQVIEIDPEFALGYTLLQYLYENHWIITGNPEDLKIEKEYALKALRIDPDLPEANAGYALQIFREGEQEKSFYYFRKALEINPNNPTALHIMGLFYNAVGLLYEAEMYNTKALELNPMNVFTLNSRGWNLTFLGQFEQGQKCFKKALQIQPNLVVVLNGYAFSLMMIGEYQKAQDLLDRSRTYLSSKITWFFRPVQALNFAYLGKKEEALKMNDGAGVHIVLKDYSRALDELEKIDTTAGPMSKTFHTYLALKNLPLFDPLRENPRFRSLLKKEEAKYLVNREKYIMIP